MRRKQLNQGGVPLSDPCYSPAASGLLRYPTLPGRADPSTRSGFESKMNEGRKMLVCEKWVNRRRDIETVMRLCSKCGTEVVVAVASLSFVEREGLHIHCVSCWLPLAKAADKDGDLICKGLVDGKVVSSSPAVTRAQKLVRGDLN
jgi:hypothetical protein